MFTILQLLTFYFFHGLIYAQQTPKNPSLNNVTTVQSESEELVGVDLRMVTHCETPNGDRGYCIPLDKCPKLQKQITNPKTQQFLEESKCGPRNERKTNPSVCCGKQSNYKDILPKNCGHQNTTITSRIFGGVEAKLGEFPWMARLYHRDNAGTKKFGCTGFLISSKYVLTAAHCLQSEIIPIFGPIFEVRLGEHNTKTKIDCDTKNITCADRIQTIKVKKTQVHPKYKMASHHQHNDIALIELKKDATITGFVSPICLPLDQTRNPSTFWLSGWGKTEQSSTSHIKLKVEVPFVPHNTCSDKFDTIGIKINDTQLCAGGEANKDSCTGDSGGPLMMVDGNRWIAAGVVSYGYGNNCGMSGWPGVYTNVTSYIQWIKSTVLKWSKNN